MRNVSWWLLWGVIAVSCGVSSAEVVSLEELSKEDKDIAELKANPHRLSVTRSVNGMEMTAFTPLGLMMRASKLEDMRNEHEQKASRSNDQNLLIATTMPFETPRKEPWCEAPGGPNGSSIYCSVEPSIFSGRSAQYVKDPSAFTSGRFITQVGALACIGVKDGVSTYRSGSMTVTWALEQGSGGHATPHIRTQPSLMLMYNGTASVEAGHNQAPVSASSGSVTFQISAADSQATYESLIQGYHISPEVSVWLPESTQTASVTFGNNQCDLAPEESFNGAWTLGTIGFHVGMLVDLERVENITSINGNSTLTIQRVPSNSHGDAAGYATADTHERLVEFVENYSGCDTHTPNGSYPLVTEAISLPHGGHYDINKTFRGSHANHRAGEDVDIGFNALSQSERNCLFDAYQDLFLTPVNDESLVLDTNGNAIPPGSTHVHLWSGATHKYPREQRDTLMDGYYNWLCEVLGQCICEVPEGCP